MITAPLAQSHVLTEERKTKYNNDISYQWLWKDGCRSFHVHTFDTPQEGHHLGMTYNNQNNQNNQNKPGDDI